MATGCSLSTYENKDYFDENRQAFESIKKHPRHNRETGHTHKNSKSREHHDHHGKGHTHKHNHSRDEHETHVNEVDNTVTDSVGLTARTPAVEAVKPFNIKPKKLSRTNIDTSSAHCRFIRKTADSEAIITASPTVSASSDKDGSGSVSIGMDLLDFQKAELLRASGDARCRMVTAKKKIEATMVLAQEEIRFTRAWAKQDFIRKNLGYLNGVKRDATRKVAAGIITAQDKNLIVKQINELKAIMGRFRSEADQRRDLPKIKLADIRSYHGALVEATNDLQNVEREIRTNDALKVSVSAGYRYNETFNDNLIQTENDGGFARVTVGVRLGALSARRHRLEEEAAGARLDSLFEEGTGQIWKSGFAQRASGRMIKQLLVSEQDLMKAKANTEDSIKRLSTADQPQIIRAQLLAKVQTIYVGSDLAAVRATIAQLRQNKAKFAAMSQ
jgi:hypothetical protein